jgi:hypothetical protein
MTNPAENTASTVIVCCNTLEDELALALKRAHLEYPVVWIEAGMHNQPDKLRDHLNTVLAETKAERVLMPLGHCGGACVGLKTGNFELIIPRVDDCLSLLMGSMETRRKTGATAPTYFLTAGWLRHTESMINAFARDSARFGEEKARRIYKVMLKHYRRFGFIETGAYSFAAEKEKIAPLAADMGIAVEELPGDSGWLNRLLTGPWPLAEFIIIPPNSCLDAEGWNWLGETSAFQ